MISFSWGASPPNPPLHGLRGLRNPVVRGLRGRVVVPRGVRCWLRQKRDLTGMTILGFLEKEMRTNDKMGNEGNEWEMNGK